MGQYCGWYKSNIMPVHTMLGAFKPTQNKTLTCHCLRIRRIKRERQRERERERERERCESYRSPI